VSKQTNGIKIMKTLKSQQKQVNKPQPVKVQTYAEYKAMMVLSFLAGKK
jgi:hypothetical protein